MKKILIALDNSLAGKPVIAGARALASLLDADVEAVHVTVDGSRMARTVAAAEGIPLQTVTGPVVDRLVEAGSADDVLGLALGARGMDAACHPVGSTAAAVATRLPKPVLVVPPEAQPRASFQKLLVPLEGSVSSSLAPEAVFSLAGDAEIEVVALHVYDARSIPAFTDQPQHEQAAWAREFLDRFCRWGLETVRLETRVGRSGQLIPLVADERGCDLIALGWAQELSSGRAPVVRETLERSHLPVLLVPVHVGDAVDDALADPASAIT
jgi:nucleotide-binding universal stress UspA family protein